MAFCRWRDGFLQVARWLCAVPPVGRRRMAAVPPVGHISSGGTAPAASLSVRPVVRPPPVASVPDELIAPPAVQ